jgi:hypothetical protein
MRRLPFRAIVFAGFRAAAFITFTTPWPPASTQTTARAWAQGSGDGEAGRGRRASARRARFSERGEKERDAD